MIVISVTRKNQSKCGTKHDIDRQIPAPIKVSFTDSTQHVRMDPVHWCISTDQSFQVHDKCRRIFYIMFPLVRKSSHRRAIDNSVISRPTDIYNVHGHNFVFIVETRHFLHQTQASGTCVSHSTLNDILHIQHVHTTSNIQTWHRHCCCLSKFNDDDFLAQGLGRATKVGHLLAHRSNFARMSYLSPQVTPVGTVGTSGSWTQ